MTPAQRRAEAARRPGMCVYPSVTITARPAQTATEPRNDVRAYPSEGQTLTDDHSRPDDTTLPHVTRWRWWTRWTRRTAPKES